jgi:hypothetical protein
LTKSSLFLCSSHRHDDRPTAPQPAAPFSLDGGGDHRPGFRQEEDIVTAPTGSVDDPAHDPRSRATLGDLRPDLAGLPGLDHLAGVPVPAPRKAPVPERNLVHRRFDDSEFWRAIPAFEDVCRERFLDHRFQNKHSVTKVSQLRDLVGGFVDGDVLADVEAGMRRAPMNVRLSPYILSRIDRDEPLRIQFRPVASRLRGRRDKRSRSSPGHPCPEARSWCRIVEAKGDRVRSRRRDVRDGRRPA